MKTALIILPYAFNVRNFVYTPVLRQMALTDDVRFVLVSLRPADRDAIERGGAANIFHETSAPHAQGRSYASYMPPRGAARVAALCGRLRQRLDELYVNHSLVYRFNYINGLAAVHMRLAMTRTQRRIEIASNRLPPRWIGWPCAGNRRVFRALYRYRFSAPRLAEDPWMAHLFDRYRPDVLVLSRVQAPQGYALLPALMSAKRRGVPVIGIIETWDHITTKGPVTPGCAVYTVGSSTMIADLEKYHGIGAARVRLTGHPFLDNYRKAGWVTDRASFLRRLGLPGDCTLLVFGTNATGALNAHEPSIARYLAQRTAAGAYGRNAVLYLRTHPHDARWRETFGALHAPPHVLVSRASSMGYAADDAESDPTLDMRRLANLMRHAHVVINSVGSLALDAAAFDTPVVYLGFDGNLKRPACDSMLVRYQLEHVRPVVESGGVWLVRSYEELDRAILEYSRDPALHAAGRKTIRDQHLEPFDGRAAERLVGLIARFARGALCGPERDGFWSHPGISERQEGSM